jgi:O-antigen ligase
MLTTQGNSSFWKAIEYLFYAFFALFPFVSYGSYLYTGTATRSVNLIVFAALVGIAFGIWLLRKGSNVSLVKSPPFLALLLHFVSLVVSGFVGLSFSTSFWSVATRMTGIWYLLSLGFLMLVLWAVIAERAKHTRLILVILFSTALYSVLDLLGKDGFGWLGGTPGEAFTFGNTTFAAMYIFGAFLLSLYYLSQAEKKKWWMYTLPLLLVINPNILSKNVWVGDFSEGIIGAARATSYVILLSAVALLGIWAVSKIKDKKMRSTVSYSLFGLALLGVLFSVFSLLSPTGYLRETYLSRGTAARPLVWEMSERAVGERPYFGYGGDNFERVFEQQYDNRLLQEEYGNEAWFDRAHNVVIDQLVDNGGVGLFFYFLSYIAITLALLYVALRAEDRRDRILASVLITYFTLHLVELQTAFDTSISYPMLAFMFVSGCVLFHRTLSQTREELTVPLAKPARYAAGGLLTLFFVWSLIWGAWPLMRAEWANGAVRTAGAAEKRLPLYPALFGTPVDEQGFLWRTVTDFERGIGENPKVLEDPKKVEDLKKEIAVYEAEYRAYVAENPNNFRAHLNLADVLIYQMLFGVDKLAEAQEVLDRAIALTPNSPQPYWMKSVAYLYMKKFPEARQYAKQALELNPQIKQSQKLIAYIERSIKTFPDIDLFFFQQI